MNNVLHDVGIAGGNRLEEISVSDAAAVRKPFRLDARDCAFYDVIKIEKDSTNIRILFEDFRQGFAVATGDVHQSLSGKPAEVVSLEHGGNHIAAELGHGVVEGVVDLLVLRDVVEARQTVEFFGDGFAGAQRMG